MPGRSFSRNLTNGSSRSISNIKTEGMGLIPTNQENQVINPDIEKLKDLQKNYK